MGSLEVKVEVGVACGDDAAVWAAAWELKIGGFVVVELALCNFARHRHYIYG